MGRPSARLAPPNFVAFGPIAGGGNLSLIGRLLSSAVVARLMNLRESVASGLVRAVFSRPCCRQFSKVSRPVAQAHSLGPIKLRPNACVEL